MKPFDTLMEKDTLLAQRELAQLTEAAAVTLQRGLDWLVGQMSPGGPMLERQDFAIHYKVAWALCVGGRRWEALRIVDWLVEHGQSQNGDIVFSEREAAEGVEFLRAYRESYILRVAARLGHPLAEDAVVRGRFLSHLDPETGGVFGCLDEAGQGDRSGGFNLLTAAAFGMCAIELGELDAARAVGALLMHVVSENEDDADRFFYAVTGDGSVDRHLEPGLESAKVIVNRPTVQPTHFLGIAGAFMAELCAALGAAGHAAEAADVVGAAWKLVEFDARLPFEAAFSWNRVKLAWSAGLLMEVTLAEPEIDMKRLELLYRLGRRTYVHTLVGTQLASGGWGHDLYPTGDDMPELTIDQRTMEGMSAAPTVEEWTSHRKPVVAMAAEPLEVSGENVFVTYFLERGLRRLSSAVESGAVVLPG